MYAYRHEALSILSLQLMSLVELFHLQPEYKIMNFWQYIYIHTHK